MIPRENAHVCVIISNPTRCRLNVKYERDGQRIKGRREETNQHRAIRTVEITSKCNVTYLVPTTYVHTVFQKFKQVNE